MINKKLLVLPALVCVLMCSGCGSSKYKSYNSVTMNSCNSNKDGLTEYTIVDRQSNLSSGVFHLYFILEDSNGSRSALSFNVTGNNESYNFIVAIEGDVITLNADGKDISFVKPVKREYEYQ